LVLLRAEFRPMKLVELVFVHSLNNFHERVLLPDIFFY
jgi:hypothetical protein